ncbi:uncharacterized protein si:dkeyp-114g9.1 isoform X2 [Anguilla rostrata]|uniref:F-box only protein n=1 Tax=Anguilla anguilla TaxID=7936 RepID=A0A9D3RXC2_ANGAN|nr:uncharacterized protein si:dkeyp-114g9.1 [Anguilla anguilla]KAG5846645.1 hypothetical protein ANANG_G00117190 [Anguilla anguilla]
MALEGEAWERELREQFSLLSSCTSDAQEDREHAEAGAQLQNHSGENKGFLHLSEEVLILIFKRLDAFSLLRVGSTCRTFFRVCSCNSLWKRHFQASFGVQFSTATCLATAKVCFRLLFMWRTLYRSLHCNRSLQEKLFAEIPLPPHKYWTQWLVLEENVPLPSVTLPSSEILMLWGLEEAVLEGKNQENEDEGDVFKFEWKDLYRRALEHHGSEAEMYQYVLNRHAVNDHTELEALYHQYSQCRFQWLFTYWLFRQPAPFDRQLRWVYLQWRKHSKRKVASWGGTLCDVRYLATLHPVTSDYWRGKLARGDETVGIQTVENYFSMCKSLVSWILGRDWGRLKRRKVYEDTLDGVYRLLKRDMQNVLIERGTFWQVAKVQMARVCALEEAATNYVNWRIIETLPYYRLYLVSGNVVYLEHVKGFLHRKRLVHSWIYQEENALVRHLLSDELYSLLEYDTKITQECLHGDSAVAQLGRTVWLYLHSGQQPYMEAVKGLVLRCAQASLDYRTSHTVPGWCAQSVS